jgi:hypothetical protein
MKRMGSTASMTKLSPPAMRVAKGKQTDMLRKNGGSDLSLLLCFEVLSGSELHGSGVTSQSCARVSPLLFEAFLLTQPSPHDIEFRMTIESHIPNDEQPF